MLEKSPRAVPEDFPESILNDNMFINRLMESVIKWD